MQKPWKAAEAFAAEAEIKTALGFSHHGKACASLILYIPICLTTFALTQLN